MPRLASFALEMQGMTRGAIFSPDRRYRYTLERRWSEAPMLLWILLNPSRADAERDDATNRRGITFSIAWDYGACVFVNLFAFRSPEPAVMKAAYRPVGAENDRHILEQVALSARIVVGWGADGDHRGRDREVLELIAGHDLYCLGTTRSGQPRHPLYVRGDTPLRRFIPGPTDAP